MNKFKFSNGSLYESINGEYILIAHTPIFVKNLEQAVTWWQVGLVADCYSESLYESQELAYLQADE
jgi:hypothetical protein